MAQMFLERARRHGGEIALRYREGKRWPGMTWDAVGQQARAVAKALVELGVGEGERVAIFSPNRPEWTIADLGILTARAVSVPVYPTSTPKQAEFILRDAGARVVFVGRQDQYDRAAALPFGPGELTIVAFDPGVVLSAPGSMHLADLLAMGGRCSRGAEIDARLGRATEQDLLTLIYTSGTTGDPKGVMLTQSNFLSTIGPHDARLLDPNERDRSLCFLPLSHVFERCWTYYALGKGMVNHYLEDSTQLLEALVEVRPTIMCAVPRFYEKVYGAVVKAMDEAPAVKRKIFWWAIGVGREWGAFRKEELRPPVGLSFKHGLAELLVLKKLRRVVGGRIRFFPCAGAPLAREIEEFFWAAGIFITYGYGLTETTATVTCHEPRHFTFGTVGKPLRGIEVRIGEGSEVQVKGPTVMRGYFNRPEATAEAFVDGWFRTGDAGLLDEGGRLVITDRIKDLIKTAGGKYVAPQMLETAMGADPFIEQAAVVGDRRPFITALIVPCFQALEEHARSLGLRSASREELLGTPEIQRFYQARIDLINKDLARHEQVKRFRLLAEPFTVEGGEITPTLKVKRKAVAAKYAALLDTMYEEPGPTGNAPRRS